MNHGQTGSHWQSLPPAEPACHCRGALRGVWIDDEPFLGEILGSRLVDASACQVAEPLFVVAFLSHFLISEA